MELGELKDIVVVG